MLIYYQDNHDCKFAANLIYHNLNKFGLDFNKTEVRLVKYGYSKTDIINIVRPGETVICLGLGYFNNDQRAVDRINTILNIASHVIWIDGHKNTEDIIKEYPQIEVYYVDNHSVSHIVHYEILKGKRNKFVDCIDDRCCNKVPRRESTLLYIYCLSLFSDPEDIIWQAMYKTEDIECICEMVTPIYNFMLHVTMLDVESESYEVEIGGVKVLAINSNYKYFLVDLMMKHNRPIILWNFDGRHYRYLLHSCDTDIDCLEVTKKYNGFGNKYRASFLTNEPIFPNRKGVRK